MARGGYRPGAGRPKKEAGETERAVREAASRVGGDDVTPLEFLLSVVNDAGADFADRMRAAVAAAPYVHARAEVTAGGKKEQKQAEAERVATGGKFAPRSRPKLVASNT